MSCNRTGFHKRLTDYGAQVVTGISNKTSHLITTHVEANNPTGKVLAAMNKNVSCVSEAWVNDSITSGMALDVSEYLLIDTNLQGGSSASETKNSDINNNTRSIVANARNAGTVIKVRANQSSANAARQVMLAEKYVADKMGPTGWWISEKLDGVRAYWDGTNFYSRHGNAFPAPE